MEIDTSFLDVIAQDLATAKADQVEVKHGALKSKQEYIQEEKTLLLRALQNNWTQVIERMERGRKALENYVDTLSSIEKVSIQEELECVIKKLPSIDPKSSLDISLQQQLGIKNSTLLLIYKVGYQCFQEKNFEEASALFLTLVLFNPRVVDYWLALGTTQRALHTEKAALYSFSLVSLLDPGNISSRIHSIDIYLHMGKPGDAQSELDALKEIIKEKQLDALLPQLQILESKIRKHQKVE